MRHTRRNVGAVLLAAAVAVASSAAQTSPTLHTETVYYDYLDDHGNLAGGVVFLSTPARLDEIAPPLQPSNWNTLRGGADNRVDLVIVGDGYTAAQLGLYAIHADTAIDDLFAQQPFAEYAALFNVHRVDVVSNESGVDNDPTQGISRDTALDMAFWCGGTERLLCVSVGKAYSYANQVPEVDQVLAIANSTKYGGAGYPGSDLATLAGGNSAAPEIAIHELGHSLGNLADEYTYGGPANYNGPERNEPNASILDAAAMAAANAKWAAWLGYSNPAFDGLVSTYEGAVYSVTGVYRPTNNSKMRALGRPFNPPSVEALVIQIYREVDPIDAATPTAAALDITDTVFVDPVDPVSQPLTVTWTIDDQPAPTLDGQTEIALCSLGLSVGQHTIAVRVVDETPWVRDEAAREQYLTATRAWIIDIAPRLGDYTGDALVDFDDFARIAACWGAPCGDLTGDATTDFADFSVFGANWHACD